MKHIISWYLIPYISAVAIALVVWIISILATDGIIPISIGLIFFLIMICTIPIMVYLDYRKLKDLVIKGATAYNEPGKRIDFYQEMTTMAAGRFGFPEVLAEYIIQRIVIKFNLGNELVPPT